MYLFDSAEEFFQSQMWKGERFYEATHYRPWFGWIYVALYDDITVEDYKKDVNPDVRIKIGQTSNIDRRQRELISNSGQKASSIVFVWSVPLSIKFESDIKTLLAAFIKTTKQPQTSEIIRGIPITPLINIIQLSIFKTCADMKFIRTDVEFNLRPPDTIQDFDFVHVGTKKYIVPQVMNIEDKFLELNVRQKGDITLKEYIFTQDKRIRPATKTITPQFEGQVLNHSTYMRNPVFQVGTYVYAKYTDPDGVSGFFLAQIVGYGDAEHSNQYAVEWLVTERGRPIRTDDGLEISQDKWEWTKNVEATQRRNPKLLADFPELKVGRKKNIPKLRV